MEAVITKLFFLNSFWLKQELHDILESYYTSKDGRFAKIANKFLCNLINYHLFGTSKFI